MSPEPRASGTDTLTYNFHSALGTVTGTVTFNLLEAPAVTRVSPDMGPVSGGGTATLTGANFTADAEVFFGSVRADVVDALQTQISVTIPAGNAPGTVPVTVVTNGGTSAVTPAASYTYVAAPTVTSISPATGAYTGGNDVTIAGTNLTGATRVMFGSTAGSIVSNTGTQIVAIAPASSGAVDISVVTLGGTSVVNASTRYTYSAYPTAVDGTMTAEFETATQIDLEPLISDTYGTLTVSVTARPDPSRDPEVSGIAGSQVTSARRFADTQANNFQQRLRSLRSGQNTSSNGLRLNFGFGNADTDRNPQQAMQRQLGMDDLILNQRERDFLGQPVRSGTERSTLPSRTAETSVLKAAEPPPAKARRWVYGPPAPLTGAVRMLPASATPASAHTASPWVWTPS